MPERQHWIRSEFIEELNSRGYKITGKDVTWATKMKLVNPVRMHRQLFAYTEDDMAAMAVLGELKNRGVDRHMIEAIVGADSVDLFNTIVTHIEENKREGVKTYAEYVRNR